MSKLYKSVIVIYTDYHPFIRGDDIDVLARSACVGDAYCNLVDCELVESPEDDEHFDSGVADFFDLGGDDNGDQRS